MLNLKKLIASICAATVALTSVAFAANYSDVTEDSAYYEAVETLSKLDIFTGYEDGTFKPEDTVTRAEMSALIARILGYDETAKGAANTIFTDVPSTHWASGYIAQATNMNILNGYGDGTFGPDDQVTYEQAVKMIMATLGYTPYAENNGGYPTGYLAAAQKYSVTKGVSNAVIGSGANRGTIAQLLNNAIDTPLMEQSSWNTNGEIEYTIYDGGSVNGGGYRDRKTLMSENLGVVKLAGVVTKNSVVGLDAVSNFYDATAEVKITVDVRDNYKTTNTDNAVQVGTDKQFVVGNTDAESYLGQAVVFYVFENDKKDYEVISIAADTSRNDVVEFTLDQFDYYDAANKELYFYANASDNNSTAKKIDGAKVVCNGLAKTNIDTVFSTKTQSALIAAGGNSLYGGKVTLIDNNTTAGYDVVFVEIAATAVVKEVSEDTVIFKNSATVTDGGAYTELVFDEDADNTLIELTKDGEVIDYTDLKEWDVLSLIAPDSYNKGYIQARVISNTVTGTITADFTSKTSKGGKGFKVDGAKYDVADGAYKADKLVVGDGGTFYIDEYGKIAAFNEDSSIAAGGAGNYAYVFKTVIDDNALGDKTLIFQLITANGVEVIDAASTMTLYKNALGKTLGNTDTDKRVDVNVENLTKGTAVDNDANLGVDLVGKVVKYTTNASGYVKTVTMAGYDADKFKLTTSPNASYTFDAENGKLGKFVDEDSIVFFIDITADKCEVGSLADLADDTDYNVKAIYADSKADDNNIIVLNGGKNNIEPSSSVAVITDISAGKNAADENVLYISYIQDGQEVEAVETINKTEIGFNAPTVGDVVKIKINSAGKIANISKVFDFEDDGRTLVDAEVADYLTGFGGIEIDNKYYTVVNGSVGDVSKDVYYGGVVSFAKGDGKIAFNLSDSNSDIQNENTATIINISKAKNIYVIDFTGRNISVKRGSGASFRYNENFYTVGKKIVDPDDNTELITIADLDDLDAYTDHVFVREYDENIEDVIIVKAPKNYRVK